MNPVQSLIPFFSSEDRLLSIKLTYNYIDHSIIKTSLQIRTLSRHLLCMKKIMTVLKIFPVICHDQ